MTTTRQRLPEWIRDKKLSLRELHEVKSLMRSRSLHTVCEELACPNRSECFSRGTATFMILGDVCTRACGFCNATTGRPYAPPSPNEPLEVAQAAFEMGLQHVVVTSVTRDDLTDGGAAHFAATIRALRDRLPEIAIEVLVPDFRG
ncbi:MAG: lipoyl synthase, partial [Thermoanaerobaculia bacterium]|nr:lipoyl synthase [Thermoanaerobaculia bacterium]